MGGRTRLNGRLLHWLPRGCPAWHQIRWVIIGLHKHRNIMILPTQQKNNAEHLDCCRNAQKTCFRIAVICTVSDSDWWEIWFSEHGSRRKYYPILKLESWRPHSKERPLAPSDQPQLKSSEIHLDVSSQQNHLCTKEHSWFVIHKSSWIPSKRETQPWFAQLQSASSICLEGYATISTKECSSCDIQSISSKSQTPL